MQFAESLAELRRAEQMRARSEKEEEDPTPQARRPVQTRATQHAQLARQAERTARYEQIVALQKQGVKHAEMARQLGVTARTIQRWHQGCRKGAQLEREVRAKGYNGT